MLRKGMYDKGRSKRIINEHENLLSEFQNR